MSKERRWQGCQLVNPLCPDDLCTLPYKHEGLHLLLTMSEPSEVSDIMFMIDDGKKHREETLYKRGWEVADKLWPRDEE